MPTSSIKKSIFQLAKSKDHVDIPSHVLEQAADIADTLSKKKSAKNIQLSIVPSKKIAKNDKHDQSLLVMLAEDQSFLIDSITAGCVALNHVIEGVLHTHVTQKTNKKPQSLIIMTIAGLLTKEQEKTLTTELENITHDVRFATRDWQAMRGALKKTMDSLDSIKKAPDKKEFQEYKAFLQYLHDNNFTLLGYREYKLKEEKKHVQSSIVKKTGLGLLSDDKKPVYLNKTRQHLPEELQRKRLHQPTLTIAKVNKVSTVHRRVMLDAIAIKTYDDKGKINGERLFIGLFTSVTYSRSVQDIPYLNAKVESVIKAAKFEPNSHNYRAMMHILEKYPRDEMFQIDVKQLKDYTLSIMALQEQPKLALYTRVDPFKRYVSCLVYIPRERYETQLRQTLQDLLETRLNGHCDAFYTVLDDSPLARVLYTIRIDETDIHAHYNFKQLETDLIDAARRWEERIRDIMLDECETEAEALNLFASYHNAFPPSYHQDVQAEKIMYDIRKLEDVKTTQTLGLDIFHTHTTSDTQLRLKTYNPLHPVILSDILPVLENFGFRVLSEKPYKITPTYSDHPVWIHDFLIEYRNGDHAQKVKDIKKEFESGMTATINGACENDALNALIAKVNMPWRDVLVLRAYTRYMRQAGLQYTPAYIMQAITAHPDIADLFLELFYAYHKPAHDNETRKKLIQTNQRKIKKALNKVESFDHDRIFRILLQLISATLRTNFFQEKSYVSFKLDSSAIDILPEPRPMVEIFVYSPRVEGIHLRGGKIARGGLRWSDRHEDFRTEVLGLMKAQMVKNAVIIPVGSKGGFVVKQPPKDPDRQAFIAEGIECYKIFIRGLLDITDNIKNGKIIPPKGVIRHDDDDPYLVVAADKGTATFSDIANGLSQEYGFWLGDAFASGGSAGYDHKAMGITARGAWESVKRNFLALGHDTQTQDFDVIGVGDMGGDVFGNGMLLSSHIRLVGAFNHLHIFCDPDPDIKTSFKERTRLFKAVKGWDAYNEKLLSKGGRIYSRSDKSLKLTPEIQARFGLDKKNVSPQELMHAMLKAETDLLWFGGIGTYIKAPSENNADAGDKANDAIRVDAHEVRARVIGEGANLGVTQAARIALNLLGVKIYADFVDNAGGVNSSDIEVNIKILLQQVMQDNSKALSLKSRNMLLKKMTGDVENLVLRNNYQQALAIAITAHKAYENLSVHSALIDYLESNFGLNRAVEGLPTQGQIDARARDGQGLTAPELATLISYSKIKLYKDLENSDLPDHPDFDHWIENYFPADLQKKYQKRIHNHQLRRAIIATQMANALVNRLGPTFMMKQTVSTGADISSITNAYIVVRDAFKLPEIYSQLESLDGKVNADDQIAAFSDIANFAEYMTTWILKYQQQDHANKNVVTNFQKSFAKNVEKLSDQMIKLLPESTVSFVTEREQSFFNKGFPKKLASHLALLPILNAAGDIITIADKQNQNLATVGRVYYGLNHRLSFTWLRSKIRETNPQSRWEADTLTGITNRLYIAQARLTKRIIAETCGQKACKIDPVGMWMESNQEGVMHVLETLERLRDKNDDLDFAMLTALELNLSQLA